MTPRRSIFSAAFSIRRGPQIPRRTNRLRVEILSPRPYTPKRNASIGIPCITIPILRVRTPCLNSRSHTGILLRGIAHHDLRIAPSSSGVFPRDPVVTGVPVVPSSPALSHPAGPNLPLDSPLSPSPSGETAGHIRTPNVSLPKLWTAPLPVPSRGGQPWGLQGLSASHPAPKTIRRSHQCTIIATRNNALRHRSSVLQRPHQTCVSQPFRHPQDRHNPTPARPSSVLTRPPTMHSHWPPSHRFLCSRPPS